MWNFCYCLVLNILKFPLYFFDTLIILELCFMMIKYMGFFKLIFCQWSFNFIELCSETVIYINLKFVKTYIMAQHAVTSDKYFICAWKDCFLPLGINLTFIYKVELSTMFFRSYLFLLMLFCLLHLSIIEQRYVKTNAYARLYYLPT